MSEPPVMIAMAFPVDPEKRKALRRLVQMPLAVYAGAVEMPCAECGEPLSVGPRVSAMVRDGVAKVYCPVCAARESAKLGGVQEIRNLGNKPISYETDG